jgi:hypothetical protein
VTKKYSLGELERKQTLRVRKDDDLKIDTDLVRVWLSRPPGPRWVTVEHNVMNEGWVKVERYNPNPYLWGGSTL